MYSGVAQIVVTINLPYIYLPKLEFLNNIQDQTLEVDLYMDTILVLN